jgi:hypothetical protein
MNHTAPPVTPERILNLGWAFAPPLVIETAVRHRVFDVLAKQVLTLDELVRATGASSRGFAAVANVLVGLGLPVRDNTGRYALLPKVMRFWSATSRISSAAYSAMRARSCRRTDCT